MVLERERMHNLVEAIEKSLYPAAVVAAMASNRLSRCLLTTRNMNAFDEFLMSLRAPGILPFC